MKALVVDDSPFTVEMIMTLLHPHAQICDFALNGKEAVELACRAYASGRPYDLICLDVEMPEMDGLATLWWMRNIEREAVAPPGTTIWMMTAHNTPSSKIATLLQWGCDGCIAKTNLKNDLICNLRNHGLLKCMSRTAIANDEFSTLIRHRL